MRAEHTLVRAANLMGLIGAVLAASTAMGAAPAGPAAEARQEQVRATERAFAKTLADRDLAAFGRYVSKEAVFMSGSRALRGRDAVVAAWSKFFKGEQAPFSWEPDKVEVLRSGHLALSSGPVRDASGKLIATFNSIWRLEAPGTWRIIFDNGCDVCASCATTPGSQ